MLTHRVERNGYVDRPTIVRSAGRPSLSEKDRRNSSDSESIESKHNAPIEGAIDGDKEGRQEPECGGTEKRVRPFAAARSPQMGDTGTTR